MLCSVTALKKVKRRSVDYCTSLEQDNNYCADDLVMKPTIRLLLSFVRLIKVHSYLFPLCTVVRREYFLLE